MLSDMLLVSTEVKKREILLKYLYLDQNSSVGLVPDGKYLKNVITVIGKNGILSFYTEDLEKHDQIYEHLKEITSTLLENFNNRMLRITA